jgi:hypothetical protein
MRFEVRLRTAAEEKGKARDALLAHIEKRSCHRARVVHTNTAVYRRVLNLCTHRSHNEEWRIPWQR